MMVNVNAKKVLEVVNAINVNQATGEIQTLSVICVIVMCMDLRVRNVIVKRDNVFAVVEWVELSATFVHVDFMVKPHIVHHAVNVSIIGILY